MPTLAASATVGHVMRERVTRGDLPHWYMPGAAHFVTYRLADTIPIDVLGRLRAERELRVLLLGKRGADSWENKSKAHKQFFADYDQYLDQGLGKRWLESEEVAKIIIDNLYHHHEAKYQLLEYTVMPNHVHVLLVPFELDTDAGSVRHVTDASISIPKIPTDFVVEQDYLSDEVTDTQSPLTKIMHSLKSYTANEANRFLSREGRFWQRESYDHWVRDHDELGRVAEYIVQNPVQAKLVANAWDWPYGSAFDRRHVREKRLPEWW